MRYAVVAILLVAALAANVARAAALVGVNQASVADFGSAPVYADALGMFRQPGAFGDPYDPVPSLVANASGIPQTDFSTFGSLNSYPAGTYTLTYTGAATVTANGATIDPLGKVVEGVHSLQIQIDPAAAAKVGGVVLNFANVSHLGDLHLWSPGSKPGDVYRSDYLATLSPYTGPIRVIDPHLVNTPTETSWSTRANPASPWKTALSPGLDGSKGTPWEDSIALANATHRDLWVNVPVTADASYLNGLAALLESSLSPGLKVYAAWGNETWNAWGSQGDTVDALAAGDPRLPHADKYSDRARETALQSANVAQAMVKAGVPTIGVFEGWDAVPYYNDQGLAQLKTTYGAGLGGIQRLAVAPYPGNPYDAPNLTAASSADDVFATLASNLHGVEVPRLNADTAVADQYGVKLSSYEGGPALVGLPDSIEQDPRMGLFMGDFLRTVTPYFDVTELYSDNFPPTPGGDFGILDGLTPTPKWEAVAQFTGVPDPSTALLMFAATVTRRRRHAKR